MSAGPSWASAPPRLGAALALVFGVGLASLALPALGGGSPLAAQQEISLDRVDALVAEGRTEEARRTLERWWREHDERSRSRVEGQRSLWLRALLTLDAVQASRDYERLVVEYPGGPFSDEAMLRLAQAAHARGDLPAAAGRYRALLQDYPESPARLDAREWLARYGEAAATLEGLGRADEAITDARPAEPVPPAAGRAEPSSPPRSEEGPREGPHAPARATHAVQLGAFASPDRAEALAERLRGAGFDPRIVQLPENRLLRVRVGRLTTAAEARRMARRLDEAGFPAYPVADVSAETPVGG